MPDRSCRFPRRCVMASILSATVRQIVMVVARFVKWSEGDTCSVQIQTPSTGYMRVLIFVWRTDARIGQRHRADAIDGGHQG